MGVPTGSVTFTLSDPAPLHGPGHLPVLSCLNGDTQTLVSGSAECQISGGLVTAQSPTTVSASYSGDSNYSVSASSAFSETVGKGTAGVTVTSSAQPQVTAGAVKFTATVAATAPSTGLPTGTVTWTVTDAAHVSVPCKLGGAAPLTDGKATCKIVVGVLSPSAGPYTVTGAYSGDANFMGASGSFTQDVVPTTSKTKVQVTAPSASHQPGSFTAIVSGTPTASGTSSGTPAGTVTFTITGTGEQVITCNGDTNTITLESRSATCIVSSALVAKDSPYTVTAQYGGDANFEPSTSSAKTVAVG
jgi:hypothetical protein